MHAAAPGRCTAKGQNDRRGPGVTHQELPRPVSQRCRSARAAATTDWDAVYSGKSQPHPFVGPIEARALTGKGRGLVATRDIPAGELLLVSRPLVYTSGQASTGMAPSMEQLLDRLNSGRFTPHELAWLRALSTGEPEVDQRRPVPPHRQADTVGPGTEAQADNKRRIQDKDIPKQKRLQLLRINVCGGCSDSTLCVLRKHGEVTSYLGLWSEFSLFNHSCACNSDFFTIPDDMQTLIVRATKDVPQGEELTISYIGHHNFLPVAQRQARLHQTWSFTCACPRCIAEADPAYALLAGEAASLRSTVIDQMQPQMHAAAGPQGLSSPQAPAVVANGLAQLRPLVDGFEQQLSRSVASGAIDGESSDWLRASAVVAYAGVVQLMDLLRGFEAEGSLATAATKDILAYEAILLRAIASAAPGSCHELRKAAQIYTRAKAYGARAAAAVQARAMLTKVLKVRYGAELKRGTMTKLVKAAEEQAQPDASA